MLVQDRNPASIGGSIWQVKDHVQRMLIHIGAKTDNRSRQTEVRN
jgi:hypothetical protein